MNPPEMTRGEYLKYVCVNGRYVIADDDDVFHRKLMAIATGDTSFNVDDMATLENLLKSYREKTNSQIDMGSIMALSNNRFSLYSYSSQFNWPTTDNNEAAKKMTAEAMSNDFPDLKFILNLE